MEELEVCESEGEHWEEIGQEDFEGENQDGDES